MAAFAHALTTGVLVGAAYLAMDRLGLFENRTRLQKFLISLPVYFVLILVMNLIWPGR